MKKYRNLPMDFADGTLVALGEELETDRILTLDRRGFGVFRLRNLTLCVSLSIGIPWSRIAFGAERLCLRPECFCLCHTLQGIEEMRHEWHSQVLPFVFRYLASA